MTVSIAAACGLVIALRLRQAGSPMTFDEYASIYFSRHNFSELWGWWMLRETNPPLFYSVLKLWRMAVPESEAALRALPLVISLAQIGLVAWFAARTYGRLAVLLCLILFALSPSDIFVSDYIRGYGLAKLAVTISFLGLVAELRGIPSGGRGWIAYAAGSVVAIYCHTTMLAWPVIATGAVLFDAAIGSGIDRARVYRLLVADFVIVILSAWVVTLAVIQLSKRAANISWIEPLSLADYGSSLNLQLLLDGTASSAAMALLLVVGILRTWGEQVTRLALFIVLLAIVLFKAADLVHPVVSDYTLHWCAIFTTLMASASLAERNAASWSTRRALKLSAPIVAIVAILAIGLYELFEDVWIPQPQDFRYTIRTVARAPNAVLLVSHESMGVVVQQACMIEFHRPSCPFRLIVMANPAQSDSWAFGGYRGPITAVRAVPAASAAAQTVYAFSRYVYTPLDQLGLDPGDYREVQWDDGELIGPIPPEDFISANH
ncbi:MAG TPA: hypothetical protein VLM36_13145 [Sphingomicrobium sp.]|nr:hypothetical protein [Sphingomicrobium sp.]